MRKKNAHILDGEKVFPCTPGNITTGFTQDSTDSRRVTVYRSVITNTSKEMSCFSDFPFPGDFPNYLPHSLVLEYFRMYARHFDLLRHIRFQVSREPKATGRRAMGSCRLEVGRDKARWQPARTTCLWRPAFKPHVLNKAGLTQACPPVSEGLTPSEVTHASPGTQPAPNSPSLSQARLRNTA